MSKFEAFSAEAAKFFRSLRKNNTREWFQPRKEIYETAVRAPMEDLVAEINIGLGRFAPLYIAEPKKAVFRIYRDTRFSNNKTPYKTNIAAYFPRGGMGKLSGAGYYLGVSDEGVEIAGGLYTPGPPQLLAIRTQIAAEPKGFGKIVKHKKLVEYLGPLAGSSLMRVPKGFDSTHPAADWIRMKQWMFYKTFPGELMTSKDLAKTVIQSFQLVTPLVEFLNEPLVKAAKKAATAERMLD